MDIQTVLFDLDGTILDTNELIFESFSHTFKTYNLSYTDDEIMKFNGPPLRKTFEAINPDLAEEMVQTYLKHNHNLHREYVKVFPYVFETLDILKKNNISFGIVTSKMRSGVDLGLEITGLDRYFQTVVTVDDVDKPKPDPESVLMAMNELNGKVETTIMVGDNYHDILAGQNAGMKTAGVSWTSKGRDFLEQYNPTYMLEDMRDLLHIVGV